MVFAVVLAVLLLCFLAFRRQLGIPFLAMVAGVAVYDAFGNGLAEQLHNAITALDETVAQQIIYGVLVMVVPMVMYFRMGKSGLFGVLRIVESVVFAATLAILLSDILVYYFSFDSLTSDLAGWLASVRGFVMAAGLIFAYVDVLLYRSGKVS